MDIDTKSSKRQLTKNEDNRFSSKRQKYEKISYLVLILNIDGLNRHLLQFLPIHVSIHLLTRIFKKSEWRSLVFVLFEIITSNQGQYLFDGPFVECYNRFQRIGWFMQSNYRPLVIPTKYLNNHYYFSINWILNASLSFNNPSIIVFHVRDGIGTFVPVSEYSSDDDILPIEIQNYATNELTNKNISKDELESFMITSLQTDHVMYNRRMETINVFPVGVRHCLLDDDNTILRDIFISFPGNYQNLCDFTCCE